MSESVASCLEYMDRDGTEQTRLFIRIVDRFFDYLNVKSPKMAGWQRKESRAPYKDSKVEGMIIENKIFFNDAFVVVTCNFQFYFYSGFLKILCTTWMNGIRRLLANPN